MANLFQRGVARPLADAVDRALDLAGARFDTGQRVRHRQTKIVVAVYRDSNVFDSLHPLANGADQLAVLARRGVAHGVGDVQRGRAGVNRRLQYFAQEPYVRPGCVLGREFHVGAERAGISDHLARLVQGFVAPDLQLEGKVNVGGSQEGVDARPHGTANRFPCNGNVLLDAARQRRDDRALNFGRDAPYRLGVAGGGDREAGLDDVHAQHLELFGE